MMPQGLQTNKAPSPSVVIPHYVFASLAFLGLAILSFISGKAFTGHYFQPAILAIVHIATLGWATMLIMGALYQLLPVILETGLYSELIARITFWLLAIGVVLLVCAFYRFEVGWPLETAALLIFSAFLLFAWNVFQTTRKAPAWGIEAEFIVTAVLWLLLTGLLGVLMAFNFAHPFLEKSHLLFLKIHAHLGIVGWFLMLIIGVSARLIPMFLIAHNPDKKILNKVYYLLNGALILLGFNWYLNGSHYLTALFALMLIAGLGLYLHFIYKAFKVRVRKRLDIGMQKSIIALALFVIPPLLGLYLILNPQPGQSQLLHVTMIYGISVFLGSITTLIFGQTYKTLPFIVWLKKYKAKAGKQRIPLPKDLYSNRLAKLQLIVYLPAVFFLMVGVFSSIIWMIHLAGVLLLITAIIYNINVLFILGKGSWLSNKNKSENGTIG